MTTQVLERSLQRGIIESEVTGFLTTFDVERAWRDQVAAVDRWESLADRGRDQSRIEQAWDEMQEATVHAMALDRAYSEQYDRMYGERSHA